MPPNSGAAVRLVLLSIFFTASGAFLVPTSSTNRVEARHRLGSLHAEKEEEDNGAPSAERTHGPVSRRFALASAFGTAGGLSAALASASASVGGRGSSGGLSVSDLRRQEETVIELFERTSPSVAYINTFLERRDPFSRDAMETRLGTGSGILWDRQGHVVTNFHVIRNSEAAEITLTAPGGEKATYPAALVGFDPDKDVAVLKIDLQTLAASRAVASSNAPPPLVPIALGNSSSLRVGQSVLAIGNPFGLDHTLTVGVVSGLGREVRAPSGRPIMNVIQTDASINPGNSGGVLLDSSGRLIGMNTAIYSASGASSGVGFAIPVDTLKWEVDSILRLGKVARPALGVSYLSASQARALGVDAGLLVLLVTQGSPAEVAGLRATRRGVGGSLVLGDVIVDIDGQAIGGERDLFAVLERKAVGDSVAVTVLRTDVLPPRSAGASSNPKEEGAGGAEGGAVASGTAAAGTVQEYTRYLKTFTVVLGEKGESAALTTGVRRLSLDSPPLDPLNRL